MVRAAVDWQYLVVKGGGMARKSDLDAWLIARYSLSDAAARSISNFVDDRMEFSLSQGEVRWHADRPEPRWGDYPDLAARFGITPGE